MQRKNAVTPRQELIRWLNDAYAMEMSLIEILDNHARDAREHPHVEQRLRLHIEESRQQAERVRQAITLAGGTLSSGKALFGDILGKAQALFTEMFRDELVKNALSDFAAENFEIASYKSLIAAAETLNLPEIADLCRQNLREEEVMALWLDGYIREVTIQYLQATPLQAAA
jgi:ferritin-like metal-binding protein YciE